MKHLLSMLCVFSVASAASFAPRSSFAQTAPDKSTPDTKKAAALRQQAIELMDNGNPDKALLLLDTARQLDPTNYVYQYEMGYAWYIKKDYPVAIRQFIATTQYANATDQCYQMLGNAYDMSGDRAKAREAYTDGLHRFPNAGRLYMENGITYLAEKSYDTAVALWEKGVQVEPTYSSNYFRLAKLFAQTNERIWAVLYGELFMNIERGTDRTGEISQLIFEAYRQSIHFSDTSKSVSLDMTSSNIVLKAGANAKDFHLPFRLNYTMALSGGLTPIALTTATTATTGKHALTIAEVSQARTLFLDFWFNKFKLAQQFPNVLLDFQRTINEKDWMEEYNYWLLMKGNQEEFNTWYAAHKEKFDAFIAWFSDHPLQLDTAHLLVRTQYDQ